VLVWQNAAKKQVNRRGITKGGETDIEEAARRVGATPMSASSVRGSVANREGPLFERITWAQRAECGAAIKVR